MPDQCLWVQIGGAVDGRGEDAPNRFLTEVTFKEMSANAPDLQERWSPGLEVTMTVADFDNANVDIVELRAVPDADAAEDVRR